MSTIRSTHLKRHDSSEQAINNWAESLIKSWLVKMGQLGMMDSKNTGMLARSLTHHIQWEARGKDGASIEYLHRVVFEFLLYGKFVDYGLGRGTYIEKRFLKGSDPANNPRKRKKWMQEPWIAAMEAMRPLIKAHTGRIAKVMMRSGFEGTAETHFKTRKI